MHDGTETEEWVRGQWWAQLDVSSKSTVGDRVDIVTTTSGGEGRSMFSGHCHSRSSNCLIGPSFSATSLRRWVLLKSLRCRVETSPGSRGNLGPWIDDGGAWSWLRPVF